MLNIFKLFKNIMYFKSATGENKLANEVAIKLRNLTFDGKLNCVWFHTPNEHKISNMQDRARLRVKQCLGLIPGVADLTFVEKNKTLFIELKKPKETVNKIIDNKIKTVTTPQGTLSDDQKIFRDWAERKGVPYVTARSWKEVEAALIKYGFLDKRRTYV